MTDEAIAWFKIAYALTMAALGCSLLVLMLMGDVRTERGTKRWKRYQRRKAGREMRRERRVLLRQRAADRHVADALSHDTERVQEGEENAESDRADGKTDAGS